MRRLKSPYVLVPLAVLILAGWFAWQLFGPSPAIIISRETTFITEPLRADGLPDYERYWLDRMRAGVTPENNAAVLFWQAMGPMEQKLEDFELICREIGVKKLPPTEEFLQEADGPEWQRRLQEWLTAAGVADEAGVEVYIDSEYHFHKLSLVGMAIEFTDQLKERPWTRAEVPLMGDWIDQNTNALERIMAGSQRPRFYSPSPNFLNDTADSLFSMSFSEIVAQRAVARSLAIRAMLGLGENRYEQAWEDTLAIYRWAQLVGAGYTLIDQLIMFSLESSAHLATLAILDSTDLSPALAKKILSDLSRPRRVRTSLAECFNQGERLFGLSSVDDPSLVDDLSDIPPVLLTSLDWNIPLRRLNRAYDAISEAAKQTNWQLRRRASVEFETEHMLFQVKSRLQKITAVLGRQRRSELVADLMVSVLMPALSAAIDAETRADSQLALVRLAAALAVYRSEQGEYPDSLDSLLPSVPAAALIDLYQEKPYVYRRTSNGYLLYSPGPNGRDDAGCNEVMGVYKGYSTSIEVETLHQLLDSDAPVELSPEEQDNLDPLELEQMEARVEIAGRIPADADDIAIRMPRPKLVLPVKR